MLDENRASWNLHDTMRCSMAMPWSVCYHSGPGHNPPSPLPTPYCVQNVQWSVFHSTTGYLRKIYLSVAVHHCSSVHFCSSVIIVPQFIIYGDIYPSSLSFVLHPNLSVCCCVCFAGRSTLAKSRSRKTWAATCASARRWCARTMSPTSSR